MICPQCSTVKRYRYEVKHHTYKPVCSTCGYKFILSPESNSVSDRWIIKALDSVSNKNTTYFTKEQLISKALPSKDRRIGVHPRQIWTLISFLILVIGLFTYFHFFRDRSLDIIYGETLLLSFLITIVATPFILFSNYGYGKHKSLVRDINKYIKNKYQPYLLTSSCAQQLMNKLDQSVFTDFQPDKVLIVDDLDYAVLLLLNDFHRNENCLILTEDMRPVKSFDHFKKRQTGGENLPVYLLHDMVPGSDWSIENICGHKEWGLKPEQITDLGINPKDLLNFKTGIWYHPKTHDVRVHVKKQRYIDKLIKEGWIFPIDCLPLKKIQPALSYCMEHKCALMSATMLTAMPLILGTPLDGSEFPTDSGFDDIG